MSLRVWLPLTKDLRQQGLLNATVINNGATYSSTGGKLGGCYIFDGVDDAITVGNLSTLVTDNFSFACWFYHDDTWSSKNYETIFGGPNGFELETKSGSTNSPVIRAYSWGQGTFTYELNKWNHLVMTRTTSETKFYLNGELKLTGTAGTIPSGNYFVGSWSSTTGQNFKGKVNDVRIYDHCLSQMEVKELAKGLVLHYPLNRNGWGQENLVMNTSIMPVHSSALKGFRVSGTGVLSHVTYNNLPVGSGAIRLTNNTSAAASCGMAQDGLSGFVTGKKYSQSCWVRANANNTITNFYLQPIWISSSQTTGVDSGRYTLTTEWQQIKAENLTLNGEQASTYSSGYCYCTIPANGWIEVCGMKVEESPIVTPWCPNSSDELATTLNINGTTEYDCSGYGNNGTRTGTFTWSSDTPKYQISTAIEKGIITSTNSFITTADPIFSVALWFKLKSGVTYTSYTDLISFSSSSYSNQPFRLEICGSPVGTSIMWFRGPSGQSGGFAVKSDLSFDTWYHTVLVSEGNKQYSYYINGNKLGTYNGSANSWTPTGNVSLGENINGVIYESDFRIYATALSASDVKSLYQNSAYIDSSGNVYGAIHSEV